MFFTSNQSIEAFRKLLNEATNFHPNIKLTAETGKSVSFLDVRIENKDGQIVTLVYHEDSAEPYIIPFKSDHPRYTLRNIIQAALNRALRYASTLELFDDERRILRLTLLYNG